MFVLREFQSCGSAVRTHVLLVTMFVGIWDKQKKTCHLENEGSSSLIDRVQKYLLKNKYSVNIFLTALKEIITELLDY